MDRESPDEFADYWWPKILAECQQYERDRRQRRADALYFGIGVISCWACILLSLFAVRLLVGLMTGELTWPEPQFHGGPEVPYT